VTAGWDEDCVRLPATEADVRARAVALEARAAERDGDGAPEVKPDGRLVFEGRWVALSPIDQTIAWALTSRFGDVVDADTLAESCGEPRLSPTSVRVHLTRIRRRIGPLGLVVRAVRGRGYVLDVDDGGAL
jgi:DNA-binding response OmpR family regulator